MTRAQKLIIFLNNFGLGIFLPVLNLFLLSHGCDLQSLSIAIGIYAAVVMLAETPSGMYADLRGRKRAYYLSCGFILCGFMLMCPANGLLLLIPGLIFYGLGAAFLSGSLDSLVIEDCIRRNGGAALHRAASSLLVCQCAGIAAGAAVSGLLPHTEGYLPHVAARLAVLLVTLILCALFLKEEAPAQRERKTALTQLRLVAGELREKRRLRIVLLCVLGGSVTLFALETYWQPRLLALVSERELYLTGFLCAAGYGANMLGSFLGGRVKLAGELARWRFYLCFAALYGCSLAALAFQRSAAGFILCYIISMAVLGAANVPEQTLLNAYAADETRASLLSVANFCSKTAGVLSSAVCAALVVPLGIPGVWCVAGGLSAAVVLAAALLISSKRAHS